MTTDLPLKALIESLENNNKDLNLPIEIIEKIYEIEKKYQYLDDSKRTVSLKEIEKVITEYVDSL
jgi:hypothetical protein